jgi:GTP-binding protein HflX
VPVDRVISPELARTLTELSHDLRCQIGLMVNRRGAVEQVIVGTGRELHLPTPSRTRLGPRSLRGLRLVHTHLDNEPLSQEDLTDLALLRLDLMAALGVSAQGLPQDLYLAHLLPPSPKGPLYEVWNKQAFHTLHLDCGRFIEDLERELIRSGPGHVVKDGQETAILVSASKRSRTAQDERLDELVELVQSSGITVLDRVIQRAQEIHPKYLMGSGKLKEVVIQALHRGADLLIFDQDLTPAQAQAITEVTDMKVIDRTQVILDVFARRAHTREGKVQVELAQLRYLLPRLSGSSTALSRLGGGIGGRGPGETKLETDRRRVRERIAHLERELLAFARHQDQRRSRRMRHDLPVISIVGYTNAGKSTLLNALTHSQVPVQDRPFETLDTYSRRLRFRGTIAPDAPRGVIITDTVGFLRDLPEALMRAFRTTLEELREADLLLHLVDGSAKDPDGQIHAVESVLEELDLLAIPRVLVFNKCDRVAPEDARLLCRRYGALGISALHRDTLGPLIDLLERKLSELSVTAPRVRGDAEPAQPSERAVGVS